MFTGHYSVGFAAKPAAPFVPLWVFVFVLLRIEKLRIVQGITEANPYDLYYNPYSHSLPGALALSLLFGAIHRRAMRLGAARSRLRGSVADGILPLAARCARGDLPLYDNSAKVGLGLWRHLAISLPMEFGLLAGGAWLYARAVPAKVMRGQSRFGSSWRYFSCFSSGTISGRRQAR